MERSNHETTAGGAQLLVDGVAPVAEADRRRAEIARRAAAPLAGGNRPLDIGLFGPDVEQSDLVDWLNHAKP